MEAISAFWKATVPLFGPGWFACLNPVLPACHGFPSCNSAVIPAEFSAAWHSGPFTHPLFQVLVAMVAKLVCTVSF